MNNENKKINIKSILIRYGVCAVIATALLFLILVTNGYWGLTEPQERLRVLCDAFSLPGLLLVLSSGLILAANAGTFNGLLYGLKVGIEIVLPFLPHKYVKYRDFVEKRKGKRIKGYGFICYTGLVFLAVGIVLLIIFHVQYP